MKHRAGIAGSSGEDYLQARPLAGVRTVSGERSARSHTAVAGRLEAACDFGSVPRSRAVEARDCGLRLAGTISPSWKGLGPLSMYPEAGTEWRLHPKDNC